VPNGRETVKMTVHSSSSIPHLYLGSVGTVYISKVKSKGHPAVYRLSLNASLPAPWQAISPGDGEVPSFQVSLGSCNSSCNHEGRVHSASLWVLTRLGAVWVLDNGAAAGMWRSPHVSQAWVRVLALLCITWTTLGRLLNISEPQFPHL
jgi:hypothetical protein